MTNRLPWCANFLLIIRSEWLIDTFQSSTIFCGGLSEVVYSQLDFWHMLPTPECLLSYRSGSQIYTRLSFKQCRRRLELRLCPSLWMHSCSELQSRNVLLECTMQRQTLQSARISQARVFIRCRCGVLLSTQVTTSKEVKTEGKVVKSHPTYWWTPQWIYEWRRCAVCDDLHR